MTNKTQLLSLNGDMFESFKTDFDSMLRKLLSEMERWQEEDATINVKFSVKLEKDQTRDFQTNGYDGMRDITKPIFKHEISTVMQAKNKKTGSLGGDKELVWDKELCQYTIRDIDNGQIHMEDDDEAETLYDDVIQGECVEVSENTSPAMLRSPFVLGSGIVENSTDEDCEDTDSELNAIADDDDYAYEEPDTSAI